MPQEQNSKCKPVEITEVSVSSAKDETDEVLKLSPQMGKSDFEEKFLKESADSSIPPTCDGRKFGCVKHIPQDSVKNCAVKHTYG